MAVIPANLLDPEGPIQHGLFPEDNPDALTARLQGYLASGVSLTTGVLSGVEQDRAVFWYGLYRAWDAVYSMMIARPAHIRQDQSETTEYSKEQLFAAKQARDEAYAHFTDIVAVVTSTKRETIPSSIAVPTHFTH